MGLFRRRTTKTVGKAIGASIRRTEAKQKTLRTLQKEAEQREKERKVTAEIRRLKAERSSVFRKAGRIAGKIGKRIATAPIERATMRKPRRVRTLKRTVLGKPAKRTVYVAAPIGRVKKVRTPKKIKKKRKDGFVSPFEEALSF